MPRFILKHYYTNTDEIKKNQWTLDKLYLRVLHGYNFLHPTPNRLFFLCPNPNRTGIIIPGLKLDPDTYTRTQTGPVDTFKNMVTSLNFHFIRKNITYNTSFHSQATKKKIHYLKFCKKTSRLNETIFSCCRRASKTRPSTPVDDESLNHH